MTDLDPELEPEHAHVLLLVDRVCGAIALDRAMLYFGVAKRTAERWLGGKALPPPVLEKLEADAAATDDFMADLVDFIDDPIDRGVPEHSLVLVEYSREFCQLLRKRFPAAEVIQGDAYAIGAALPAWIGVSPLEAVVSSLPLFTRPDDMREAVIGRSLERMQRGSPFIQFSYALTQPVKAKRIGATLELSPWIKRNLPPARVLVYRAA